MSLMERDPVGRPVETEVPLEILALIEEEVERDVAPIKEADPETAEFYEEQMRDYRTSVFLFLRWLKQSIPTQKVLYVGAGFDVLPKVVFGEENVIHTSLENYRPEEDTVEYFPELGAGKKVIADRAQLPFQDASFQLIVAFGLTTEQIDHLRNEFKRVLIPDGSIVAERDLLDGEAREFVDNLTGFETIQVPSPLQRRGESETEFFYFRKVSSER